jgi:hypothetical protein
MGTVSRVLLLAREVHQAVKRQDGPWGAERDPGHGRPFDGPQLVSVGTVLLF